MHLDVFCGGGGGGEVLFKQKGYFLVVSDVEHISCFVFLNYLLCGCLCCTGCIPFSVVQRLRVHHPHLLYADLMFMCIFKHFKEKMAV